MCALAEKGEEVIKINVRSYVSLSVVALASSAAAACLGGECGTLQQNPASLTNAIANVVYHEMLSKQRGCTARQKGYKGAAQRVMWGGDAMQIFWVKFSDGFTSVSV